MLRNTLISGVLSLAVAVTSMPAVAAPIAPILPQIDNPAVTQVARKWRGHRGWRGHRSWRGHRGWRGHAGWRGTRVWRGGRRWGPGWGGCGGWGCGWDGGAAVAAGIVGFGLGAAVASPYYYGGRCYVIQGGIRYLVACDSVY